MSVESYLKEQIKDLSKSIKGLVVFDIDDTLLTPNSDYLKVYKKEPGKEEISLTTREFANDIDSKDPLKEDWYDFRDFDNPYNTYISIITGSLLINNLKFIDKYISNNYDFCFLTARSCEDIVKKAMNDFLEFKDDNEIIKKLKNKFKENLSHAVNDEYKKYSGNTVAEKKCNILKHFCDIYNEVIFIDNDENNIKEAKKLNLNNLKIFKGF